MSATLLWRAARDAVSAYGRNPVVLVPAFVLVIAMFLVNRISRLLLPLLQTNSANVLWSIVATLLQLLILAFCFSALLSIVSTIVHERPYRLSRALFSATLRRTPVSFVLLALTLLLVMLLNFLTIYLGKAALFIGEGAGLATLIAVWVLGFAGGLIFLAFANVLCVTENLGVFASIAASVRTVKRAYGTILPLSLILFIVLFALDRLLAPLVAELVKSLIVLPYLALFLAYFYQKLKRS